MFRHGFPQRALKTERLVLRPLANDDYEAWRDAFMTRLPKQNKFDIGPLAARSCTARKFRETLARHEHAAKTDHCYVYAAFCKRSGLLIGSVDIYIIHRAAYQLGNLGYRIHNPYWNQGYGKEAAFGALRIGFNHLRLHRLEAAIDPLNKRSLKLAAAIGMHNEGRRKLYLFEGERWHDHIVFTATPEMFGMKARKPKRS